MSTADSALPPPVSIHSPSTHPLRLRKPRDDRAGVPPLVTSFLWCQHSPPTHTVGLHLGPIGAGSYSRTISRSYGGFVGTGGRGLGGGFPLYLHTVHSHILRGVRRDPLPSLLSSSGADTQPQPHVYSHSLYQHTICSRTL